MPGSLTEPEIDAALKATGKDFSSVSKNGRSVFGDAESISWVEALTRRSNRLVLLERHINERRHRKVLWWMMGLQR